MPDGATPLATPVGYGAGADPAGLDGYGAGGAAGLVGTGTTGAVGLVGTGATGGDGVGEE